MFIPARRSRGRDAVCNRMPRFLSVATIGAVTAGAAFGLVPVASAEPPGQSVNIVVDIVGDSYTAGEGIHGTYIDPADQRHRSLVAPALQALSRLASGNPQLRVDANIVASSGAATANFFRAENGPDGQGVVSPAQHDQVRPAAQVVIVGFGGNDAQLAQVLADARPAGGSSTGSPLDTRIRELGALLDSAASDEEYLGQARTSTPGQAPTLVARMLQVLAGVSARAPHARIVVTNYPLAIDPQNKHAASLIGERDLTSVRKFVHDLNRAIERAVRICQCATLVDVSGAVAGHEAYTGDSVFNERPGEQTQRELFHPNHKGASLLANPIATGIAKLLGVSVPAPSDGTITVPKNIQTRNGVPDRDGDTVPDLRDRAPNDPTRSEDAAKPVADKPVSSKPSDKAADKPVAKPKPDRPKAKPAHNKPGGKAKTSNSGHHSPVTVPAVPIVPPVPAVPAVPAVIAKVVDTVVPPPAPAVTEQTSKEVPAGLKKVRPAKKTPKREGALAKPPADKRVIDAEEPEREPNPVKAARVVKKRDIGWLSRSVRITSVIPDKAKTPGCELPEQEGMPS